MQTYTETHPWLSFKLDLRNAPYTLWLMLGECQSKCEHVSSVPLRPSTADRLYRIYLAKGVLATTAIEGNTLSEDEVLRHLEGNLKLPPSREYLSREIDNVVKGCNDTLALVAKGEIPPLTPDSIKHLNKTVLDGLDLDDGCIPGELRSHSVVVGKYRGAPVRDCELLLQKLCEWLRDGFVPPKDQGQDLTIAFAILKAVMAHLYIAWIHPFGDGNGRTARLLEFQILIGAGVPAASAHLLSNHYNATRTEYYRQLARASGSGGDVVPFVVYAVQGFLDGLRQQVDEIWTQQWDIAWQNYIHEHFAGKSSKTAVRQRRLVLDLAGQSSPVPKAKIPEISTRLAQAYAKCTDKTLARDLNALVQSGLVIKTHEGYRARKELILAFRTPRVKIIS